MRGAIIKCVGLHAGAKPAALGKAREHGLHGVSRNRPAAAEVLPDLRDAQLAVIPEKVHDLQLRGRERCLRASGHNGLPTTVSNCADGRRQCQVKNENFIRVQRDRRGGKAESM
jgi:hypothetical protein